MGGPNWDNCCGSNKSSTLLKHSTKTTHYLTPANRTLTSYSLTACLEHCFTKQCHKLWNTWGIWATDEMFWTSNCSRASPKAPRGTWKDCGIIRPWRTARKGFLQSIYSRGQPAFSGVSTRRTTRPCILWTGATAVTTSTRIWTSCPWRRPSLWPGRPGLWWETLTSLFSSSNATSYVTSPPLRTFSVLNRSVSMANNSCNIRWITFWKLNRWEWKPMKKFSNFDFFVSSSFQ